MTDNPHDDEKKRNALDIDLATLAVNIINTWMSNAQISLTMTQYLLLGHAMVDGFDAVYQDGKHSVDCSEVM